MILKRLVERYAEFDQTGFLAFHRFDCILEDTSAIKALVGQGLCKQLIKSITEETMPR